MYWSILKKDLKRKKTMNVILLLFIILSTMFAASSMNNIVTVVNVLDYYFEKAEMPDYFVATKDNAGRETVSEVLEGMESIDSYGIEPILYLSPECILYKGEPFKTMQNTSVLLALEDAQINYFDKNDQVIEDIKEGEIWISGKRIEENNIKAGDTLEIKIGDFSKKFKIMGGFKDAALGSDMMGMTRFLICKDDYEKFISHEGIKEFGGSLVYIHTSDVGEVEKVLNEQDSSIIFLGDIQMIKMTYIMDIIIAGVLLMVSVCLILIAFVVLRFTIVFTLSQEYREIGVMKAIGISCLKIRGLYMVKYFALSIVGAMIGFLASIPFGHMMLETISSSMVMGNYGGLLINIICSGIVVGIILLFCFGCTARIKKFTPVDAIRNGETGERFGRKSVLRLGKSPVRPSVFLAANDILSSPKRFSIVILTFTLCMSLLLILVNTVNTLKGDDLISVFAMTKSDVYLLDEGKQMSMMMEGGREKLENELEDIEKTLAENGMPAKCCNEVMMKFTLTHGDNICKSQVLIGVGTTADQYVYFDGTPPQNGKEIAVTKFIAEKLDAAIGDTITISHDGGEEEYMITALFQSMNNMGEGVRFHETVDVDFSQLAGFCAFQINFTDNPDKKEIMNRIEKIKEIYHTDKVYTAGEYVDTIVGVSSMLNSVTKLVFVVILVIVLFVTVLMEYSFIIKERSEIAIMKAIGFRDSTVIAVHIFRFAIAAIISILLSLITIVPATNIVIGPIFKMMGADYGIKYNIVFMEVFVKNPLIIFAVTLIAVSLSSLRIRKISSSEASNIE